MTDHTTPTGDVSTVGWQTLEGHIRDQAQKWVQRLLEEEVTETLGRLKSQRRAAVDGPAGARNGYGKPRGLALSSGTITVRRPRVRGLSERFESRVLPLFKRHTEQVGALLHQLYLHGLSSGDFDLALRGLLGEAAPLSASSLDRLKAVWQVEYEAWTRRPLGELEVVYLWVDGIYVKAGLEQVKAAALGPVAALRDRPQVGLAGVAAPLFDHAGGVVAVLTVTGPLQRFRAEARAQIARHLRSGARQISQQLGYAVAAGVTRMGNRGNALAVESNVTR